jgi:hypothetical protein
MKKSSFLIVASIALVMFLFAGCSSSDGPRGALNIGNYTGRTIVSLYVDPYEKYATKPTGLNRLPTGNVILNGSAVSGNVLTGDYMIMFEAGGSLYTLQTSSRVNASFSVEEDTALTVDIYSENWRISANSRSAEKTVIASGTVKAL